MNDTFFTYLHRLESIAFFSGYPLIYTIVLFITGKKASKNKVMGKIFSLLPFSYALVGTLYLGLQLRNMYLDRSVENIEYLVQQPWLVGWGILAMIFWIPVIAKKPVLSLLHSFVFFYLLIRDFIFQMSSPVDDRSIIRNDMKLYTDSLLLNIVTLIIITMIYFLFVRFSGYKKSSHN